MVGRNGEPVYGGLPDPPGGKINDPFQGLFVFGVKDQPEVRQYILDLLALVKRKPAIDPVGNVPLAQRVFYGA